MARIVLKKDDLRPNVLANLKNADNTAVDLTDASSVRFIMKRPGASSTKVDAAASINDAVNGQVAYQWSSGDTDTSGTYNAEFEVNWGSSRYQTFPAEDYIEVEIIDDLGGSV